MERRMIDPHAALSRLDRSNLQAIISDGSSLTPVQLIVKYFEGTVTYAEANRFLIAPEKVENKVVVGNVLARNFYDLMKRGLPRLTDPYQYDWGQATEICNLFSELSQRFEYEQESIFQNPFQSVVSVRHLSETSGISAGEIVTATATPFVFGSLQLYADVHLPVSTHSVKKAIHESVHRRDGAASLDKSSIPGNIRRIQHERRMIGVYPTFIPYTYHGF